MLGTPWPGFPGKANFWTCQEGGDRDSIANRSQHALN